jgi:hypothetical protein
MGKKKDKKRKREAEEEISNKKQKQEIDVYSQIFGENVNFTKNLTLRFFLKLNCNYLNI